MTPHLSGRPAPTPSRFISSLSDFLSRLTDRRPLGVAVSGGSDSLGLLYGLAAVVPAHKLVALTVDHGLRSAAADEARWVKAQCRRLGIRHETLRWQSGHPVTGVQAAARAGQGEAILALIAAGAPVDGLDSIGFTALFEAAREGHDAAVSALLDQGADINHIAEPHGLSLTPLHLAAIGGNAAVVQTLMQAGARPDVQGVTGATPMLWAAFEGQHDAVKALLEG